MSQPTATVCTSQPLITHADAPPTLSTMVHPPSTCHPTHCGIPHAHGPPYASQPALPWYVPHSPCSPMLMHRPHRLRRSTHPLCATATALSMPPPLPSPCHRRCPLRGTTDIPRGTQRTPDIPLTPQQGYVPLGGTGMGWVVDTRGFTPVLPFKWIVLLLEHSQRRQSLP